MGLALFENYSSTSSRRRSKYPSISVNKPCNVVFREISEFIKKENFFNIKCNEEYYDIYGEKNGYELSVQISVDGLKTNIDMSVFGAKKRGRTRRFLKTYYNLIKSKFNA